MIEFTNTLCYYDTIINLLHIYYVRVSISVPVLAQECTIGRRGGLLVLFGWIPNTRSSLVCLAALATVVCDESRHDRQRETGDTDRTVGPVITDCTPTIRTTVTPTGVTPTTIRIGGLVRVIRRVMAPESFSVNINRDNRPLIGG